MKTQVWSSEPTYESWVWWQVLVITLGQQRQGNSCGLLSSQPTWWAPLRNLVSKNKVDSAWGTIAWAPQAIILILLYLVSLDKCPKLWSVLENIPLAAEKNYFPLLDVVCKYLLSLFHLWLTLKFLWWFCPDSLSHECGIFSHWLIWSLSVNTLVCVYMCM